jgi:hypothetical protein
LIEIPAAKAGEQRQSGDRMVWTRKRRRYWKENVRVAEELLGKYGSAHGAS